MSNKLKIGFIPLADCAPLPVAEAKGFFSRRGLQVELCKQNSWAQIKQKLLLGELDAAHALVTMPLEMTMGFDCRPTPVGYAFALSRHGNAITLSNRLWNDGVRDAGGLALWLTSKSQGESLRLGVVCPHSTHEYFLRVWLFQAGLQLGDRIRLVVAPPQEMVNNLRQGLIDGFCAGEPWNQRASLSKLGGIVAVSGDVIPPCTEKVLAVRLSWHEAHREQHGALMLALADAAKWLHDPANHNEAVAILSDRRYVNTLPGPLSGALRGELQAGWRRVLNVPNFLRFHGDGTNFPWRSNAMWYADQMARWGAVRADDAARLEMRTLCLQDFYRDVWVSHPGSALEEPPLPAQDSYADFLLGVDALRAGFAKSTDENNLIT